MQSPRHTESTLLEGQDRRDKPTRWIGRQVTRGLPVPDGQQVPALWAEAKIWPVAANPRLLVSGNQAGRLAMFRSNVRAQ